MERPKKNLFLFPDDALDNIRSPMNYRYIKILRVSLMSIGFWPRKEMGEVKTGFSLLFLVIFVQTYCLVFTIAYLVEKRDTHTFMETGHIYITVLMSAQSLTRSLLLPIRSKYRKHMADFIKRIHLFHNRNESEYSMKMHKKIHVVCHIFSFYVFIQMLVGLSLFNLISLYANITTGKLQHKHLTNTTLELSVYYLYPTDSTTNRQSYIFVNIFNWLVSYLCSTAISMADLSVFLVVFHVWGHLKILLYNLKTFPRPVISKDNPDGICTMYSPTELKEVAKRIKQCINYHRFISNCTNDISEAFGPMLFFCFLFHQVTSCVLLLECSAMTVEALMRYGPLTILVNEQLIQMSIIFEMITTASENIVTAIYSIPWESLDKPNRKTVIIFMMVSQRTVQVKALGMASIGVTTMATLIKNSITYFMFLRTVAE